MAECFQDGFSLTGWEKPGPRSWLCCCPSLLGGSVKSEMLCLPCGGGMVAFPTGVVERITGDEVHRGPGSGQVSERADLLGPQLSSLPPPPPLQRPGTRQTARAALGLSGPLGSLLSWTPRHSPFNTGIWILVLDNLFLVGLGRTFEVISLNKNRITAWEEGREANSDAPPRQNTACFIGSRGVTFL